MEFGPRVRVEEWAAILRAEDDVDDDERERLWHGDGSGLQPWIGFGWWAWGVAPGWDGGAPLALGCRGLGRCPGLGWGRAFSPGSVLGWIWGVAPGWDGGAPLALGCGADGDWTPLRSEGPYPCQPRPTAWVHGRRRIDGGNPDPSGCILMALFPPPRPGRAWPGSSARTGRSIPGWPRREPARPRSRRRSAAGWRGEGGEWVCVQRCFD